MTNLLSVEVQKNLLPKACWAGLLILLLGSLSVVTGRTSHASPNTYSMSLDHIGTESGLPQNSVRAVLVDLDGFVWVGTEKGLARYDGSRFIDFSVTLDDLPEDVSLGLQLDSKNRIWSSWYTQGLRVLSANRDRVIEISSDSSILQDLHTKMPPRVIESSNGDMWFPGVANIYRLDGSNILTTIPLEIQALSFGGLVENKVVFGTHKGLLLVDDDTQRVDYVDIYSRTNTTEHSRGRTFNVIGHESSTIFCHNTGVFRYDVRTDQLTELYSPQDFQLVECKRTGPYLLFSRTRADSESFELLTLDIGSGKIIPNPGGLPETGVKHLAVGLHDTFVDHENNYWVLLGKKLYRSEGADGEFQIVDFPNRPFGIGKVFAQDRSGTIWARTDDHGLAKFSRYARRFQTTVPPPSITKSSRIRTMAVDQHDNVWLGSDKNKLLYWNRQEDTWTDMLPGNTGFITGIEILPDGTVWVIMPDIGKLIGYNPVSGSWFQEYNFDRVYSALTQTPDNRLVLASNHHLHRVDPASEAVEKLTHSPLTGQVRAFANDREGNLWVGTHEGGLIKVDSSGDTRYWNTGNSDISSDNIFSLHLNDDKLLWIGTWHGGLLSFDIETERFRHFGMKDGLPDSTIFGILEDDDGFLWLSTYSGLARFEPCNEDDNCSPEVTIFTHQDGLQGDEFDAESSYSSKQGEMFFAGAGGLNAFYPDSIPINKQAPKVKISRAVLNDENLPGAASEFEIPQNINLAYGYGELHLELSVLDFNTPSKNRIQFRNLRIDESWRDLQHPVLTLRGLDVGSHTFQFRGSNNDGLWSTHPAVINIKVAPPFYRHPLAMVFYLLLSLLIPVVYLRKKQARFIATQQFLETEVSKRTRELELAKSSRERFFANISHEICSPVHMILLMMENQLDTDSSDNKKMYKSATGYAAQLMVYLRQLVSEARSHEIDSRLYGADVRAIINNLVERNQPIANARSVSMLVEPLPLQRVAFYASSGISIFSNLLCNALMYTPEGGRVRIEGKVDKENYRLTFTNTISEQQHAENPSYFERGERSKLNANSMGGHGLGLSIVSSAVEVLGGNIDLCVDDNHDISFIVSLPLANDSAPLLPVDGDWAFSHEQLLAIKLISEDEQSISVAKTHQQGLSVLIIEDDMLMANIFGQALSQDYNVFVAGTYTEGVRLLRKHMPRVVLCDLFLPDGSGFEVLKAARANRMTMDSLFVMVTASISEEDKIKCQELGVDRFVTKPFSVENMKLLIENHIRLSEQRFEHRRKEGLTKRARVERVQNNTQSFEKRFNDVLEELYQDPDTTIEAIQTRMSMSYVVLMRNCKKIFGKTPKRLLINKRIDVAKILLRSSEYKIGLIAELTGFSSHSQFAIVFKKGTGQTPAAFRKAPESQKSS